MIGGAIAGAAYMRKHGLDTGMTFDVVAPALPLAQAIGRWGNWFNQELFGGPSDLPWALEIDNEHRPSEYIAEDTFHPTFLYESLWNLTLVVVLLRVDRLRKLGPFGLFFMYLAGYSVGRLWIEAIRIDTASEIAGLRVNLWVFGVLLIVSLIAVWRSWQAGPAHQAAAAAPDDGLDLTGDADDLADTDDADADDADEAKPVDID